MSGFNGGYLQGAGRSCRILLAAVRQKPELCHPKQWAGDNRLCGQAFRETVLTVKTAAGVLACAPVHKGERNDSGAGMNATDDRGPFKINGEGLPRCASRKKNPNGHLASAPH